MIGKIMSEAAHSIIGMFSAKPLSMEHKTSNSDFGSLLRPPEEQAHSGSAGKEIDTSDFEDIGVDEASSVPAQPWETDNVLPFLNQSFGSKIFGQDRTSQKIEQDQTTFNQDVMIDPETLQNSVATASSPDEEAHQAGAGLTSDILSRQANVNLGNGSQIDMPPTRGASDVADGRPGTDKRQSGQREEFQFRSRIRENAVGDEIFPSSDKGLLKLQSLQSQMRSENGDLIAAAAKASKSHELEALDVQFNDQTSKLEAGKHAAALSPLVTKGGGQADARSGLGQFDFRSSPQGLLPVATSDLKKPIVTDGEFVESVKLDLQPKIKALETSIEQQPLANFPAQLAVRETTQKPVLFNMSAPQIAERLAAEIADISVTGGPKTFEINPRNLGRMEIIFTTRGSTEIIEIQTEHRAAKDIIVQHSQLLQDILKSQGRDDLTLRVDVKENTFSSSRTDGGNLSQQENRDAREQQARPSQHRQMASSFDNTTENDPASDSSRYA